MIEAASVTAQILTALILIIWMSLTIYVGRKVPDILHSLDEKHDSRLSETAEMRNVLCDIADLMEETVSNTPTSSASTSQNLPISSQIASMILTRVLNPSGHGTQQQGSIYSSSTEENSFSESSTTQEIQEEQGSESSQWGDSPNSDQRNPEHDDESGDLSLPNGADI